MASFNIFFKASAEKELRRIPRRDLSRIAHKIAALSEDPRPRSAEKLVGQERYRIRQGDWRVIHEIDEERSSLRIFRIGHRREICR